MQIVGDAAGAFLVIRSVVESSANASSARVSVRMPDGTIVRVNMFHQNPDDDDDARCPPVPRHSPGHVQGQDTRPGGRTTMESVLTTSFPTARRLPSRLTPAMRSFTTNSY